MPEQDPGPAKYAVHMHDIGINPGDVKKRAPWLGMPMAYPRVIRIAMGQG